MKGQFSEMTFLFFFQIMVQNLSGKLWNGLVSCVRGSRLGLNILRCELREVWAQLKAETTGPASGFNLVPPELHGMSRQALPITLSAGTTLGTASTAWAAREHLSSGHKCYCSETCQRNTRLNGARRICEKGFTRMQAHPHFTTLTPWTLSEVPWSPQLPADLNTTFPCFYLDKVNAHFLNVSLISQIRVLKYLSVGNVFVYPSCQILFLRYMHLKYILFSEAPLMKIRSQ